jgi:multidrug efflux system membrane fusion protein
MKNRPFTAVLLTVPLAFFLFSCAREAPPKRPPKRVVPVLVSRVAQKTIPVEIRAIGTVEPYATVVIKSRISGELKAIHFKEGQFVHQGDLLFTIDPRPFEAALKAAQAILSKNQALARKAEEDVRRYGELVKKDYVSREQFDQVQANFEALRATIRADEAEVENARLQLSYCLIHAPVSGRTGSLLADRGNMIKANDDNKSMVVINQIQPVYVSFAVPEQGLPEVKKSMARKKLFVEAILSSGQKPVARGLLTFVDNTVDRTTGTIKLKGTFANPDQLLWPGQFVQVVLTLDQRPDALLIPSQAIQTGQSGQHVFVVRPDSTVEIRRVETGSTQNGETVIEKGLRAGEPVVFDGQFQLISGSQVKIKKGPEKPAGRP